MKYTVSIDLDLPREKVVELYDDPANLVKWQPGLTSTELVSGTAGQPGATSKLTFKMGKRNMEMIENVIEKDLPDHIKTAYDAKNVHNIVDVRFVEVAPDKTRLENTSEFQFSGFMKLMGVLMKGAFPKQTMKYMRHFKAFAEEGKDVRNS